MGRLPFLRQVPIFADLSEEALRDVARAIKVREQARGEVILHQGARASGFYVIRSGRVQVVLEDPRQGRAHLAYLDPGDYFGEMSLLTGEPGSASVLAAEDCVLYVIPPAAFSELLSRHPQWYRRFVDTLARRLRQVNLGIWEASHRARLVSRLLADEHRGRYDRLVGRTRSAREVTRRIRELAGGDAPVLLHGEKGTGKELTARLIHQAGPRRGRAFLSLDCGQFADDEWGELILGSALDGETLLRRPPGLVGLADGGTVLLKNVELLPRSAQERLAEELAQGRHNGTRIMASTRIDLGQAAEAGRFSPRLLDVLAPGAVALPPLRTRKRDIPLLAAHFLERHARRLGRPVDARLSPHALERLLAYDYLAANVQELEDILEHAVTLADAETVRPEHIFLGRPGGGAAGRDLLRWPPLRRATLGGIFPEAPAFLGLLGFGALMVMLFAGPADPAANPAARIAWSLWWPGLLLGTFFVARFWCAVCPFATLGRLAQRLGHLNRPVPAFIQKKGHVLTTAGFLLIVWTETVADLRHRPLGTGILVLGIAAAAVITSVLLARQAWCRHLCPLGSLVGVGAMGSILELRANPDICFNKCSTHECYKGSARAPGCPLFQHTPYVDSNQTCTLCLNCVRNCPNDSPRLTLRFPAREIWTANRVSPDMVYFVGALQSVLLPVLAFQKGLLSPPGFTLAFAASALLFAGAVKGLHLLASRSGTFNEAQALKQAWYAHVPLALGGHTAFQLSHLPLVPALSVQVLRGGAAAAGPVASLPLLGTLQAAVLAGGLALSLYALRRVGRREEMGRWRSLRGLWMTHAVVMGVYALAVGLFLRQA